MRLDQLTFTRFFAAFIVVVYHFGLKTYPMNSGNLNSFFSLGGMFVSYFFILSGFVMVIAYSKGKDHPINYRQFYVNRFARIYPLYVLALIFMYLSNLHHNKFSDFVLQATFLQSWVPGRVLVLNYAGWSLSTEVFFYLVFPLIYNKVYLRFSFLQVSVGILLFYLTTIAAIYTLGNTTYFKTHELLWRDVRLFFPLFRIHEFLIGNLLGIILLRLPKSYFRNHDIVVALIATITVLVFCSHNKLGFEYTSILLFCLFILFLSLNSKGYITRFFSNKYCIILGEASYGVYILQFPVERALYFVNSYTKLLKNLNSFYLIISVLIITSLISYFIIEVPVRDYIKKILSGRRKAKVMSI